MVSILKNKVVIFVLVIIVLLNIFPAVHAAKINIKEKTKIRASLERYQHIQFSIWDIFLAKNVTIGQDLLFVNHNGKLEIQMIYTGKGNVKVIKLKDNLEYNLSLPIGEVFDFCVILDEFWQRIIIEDLLFEETDDKIENILMKSFGEIRAEEILELI